MLTNSLEASDEREPVEMWTTDENKHINFHVKNRKFIPEDISLRIFQRNFSTRDEDGRGIGTYSMKLFGEEILGGQVDFTTSRDNGTVFTFSIPLSMNFKKNLL